MAVSLASGINREFSVTTTLALQIVAFIHGGFVPNVSVLLSTGYHCLVDRYVQVIEIFEFDSSIEQ